ncbi:MAG: two-component regulator propeller domain-containing protein, partial [Bacteroidota bacterium]|nr:two-component regulator propeller domain-containing protein [Bacteroidota bacterium]
MNIFRKEKSFRVRFYSVMFFRVLNILLLSGLSWQYAFAQYANIEDLKFENYTPRNGLPSDYIETITQDKYGFIWLGTHNGLFRFDGLQFKTYVHNNADSFSLPDNDSKDILGDSTGKVWIASRKGLFYYNYAQDNFIKIPWLSPGQPINWASYPVLDHENNLWFYSNNGICRMNCRTLAITTVKAGGTTNFSYTTHRLFSSGHGTIWCFDDKDLYCFDPGSATFHKQIIVNDDGLLLKHGIQRIFGESENKFWIASFFGLYLLNTTSKSIRKFPYRHEGKMDDNMFISGFSYCPPITGDSVLWCSTPYEGLLLFNLHTKQFIKSFLQDNYDASSMGGSLCYNSFADRDGIIWVSHINGLSKLDWHNQQIKSYRVREMADSNKMVPVRKIICDRASPGNYWLITWGYGILYYNKSSNKVTRRYQQLRGKKNGDLLGSYDGVYDDRGTLWIGSDIGLSYYDPHHDQFINIEPPLPLQKPDTSIGRILNDENDNLWLGTDNGLWKFNIAQKKFHKYGATYGPDSPMVNSSVYAIHFDHRGNLYVGTHNGLYRLDTSSGKITSMIRPVGNNATDLTINYIWGLDTDRDNNLWVATRGGGLYKFDPANKTYTDYKTGNGLTTEEVRDVFVDSLQNIWVSSYDGIFKLDQETKVFTRFTPEDGLGNFNISLGRWNILNNKIYSGSPGAYSIIDPYAHPSLSSHFPVWITGIKILNRSIYFNPDSSGQITVPLNYSENIIDFEFTAISYTASAKIQYAYLLEGFDKEWHFCGNQHFANYNNLEGGKYTFRVKAMNAEGVWSDSIAFISIYINPVFWKTWWFRLLAGIVITGL